MYSIFLHVLSLPLASQAAQIEETSTFPIWLTIPLVIAVIALLVYGVVAYRKAAVVIIDELHVGTVFNKRTGNFKRFLRPGIYRIDPFTEVKGDEIYLGSQSTSGTCEELRTKEGIPLSIEYNVSFSVDPANALPAIHYKMARTLPKYATNIVAGRVKHVLRHLVEQKSIYDLYQEDAIKKLETEVRAEVSKRSAAVGVAEISANDMKLGPIRMPPQVEKALKTDYERQLQTATSIGALNKLQAVVSKFDDKHMDRLAELERLRIVESSGSLVYLMDSLVKKVRETAVPNGNGSHSNGHASPN